MSQREIIQGAVFWITPHLLRPRVEGVSHPHVVVQDDVLNQSRIPTTVVCGISSNQKRMNEPGNVLLDAGEAGLARASVVIVSQISVVDKSFLQVPTGRLSLKRIEEILRGLRFQQASFFNP